MDFILSLILYDNNKLWIRIEYFYDCSITYLLVIQISILLYSCILFLVYEYN